MIEGIKSLDKNKTWEFVRKPNKYKIVGCKWIFKLKKKRFLEWKNVYTKLGL